MHLLYSSKDPCCSLACGHRRISGRRFSSPKWVERSDDRKYVCARRLAVPKRNNFCSRTLVPWPRPAPVTISSGWLTPFKVRRGLPYTSKSFYAPFSNPGTFPNFPQRFLPSTGTTISVRLACLPLHRQNLFETYKQGQPTTVSS